MTHTPGPWRAVGMGGDSLVLSETHKWNQEYFGRGYPIAIPRHYTDQDDRSHTDLAAGFMHDDARLIAASPELLAVAYKVLSSADGDGDNELFESELFEMAKDAVKKATDSSWIEPPGNWPNKSQDDAS